MGLYQKIYERVYFPIFETHIKGRDTSKLYSQALQTQHASSEALAGFQINALRSLLKHADQSCPYYSKVFRTADFDPDRVTSSEDLTKLPLLTKEAARENYHEIVPEKLRKHVWEQSTGGSTGQPFHFAYTKESYAWRVAMSKRGYSWAGAYPGARQAYIWGIQLGKVSRIKQLKERLHHC